MAKKEEMIKKIKDGNWYGLDLSHADLNGANLRGANLGSANLIGANLNGANLDSAYLGSANLRGANLRGANLRGANLDSAYLRGANLRGANLRGANLDSAYLGSAYLGSADLRGANLNGICYNERTAFLSLCCPEEGSFVGYKKCQENKIVKLLITKDAQRSSATTRKCRASKVKVLSVENVDGTKSYDKAVSICNNNFIYCVGQIIEVKDFNEDRWEECSTGIHFFITRDEAVRYNS